MNKKYAELDFPAWFDGKDVNEAAFCREFLSKNKLIYADNAFFTPDGRLTDPLLLKEKIYAELECCAARNIPRTISNIVEIMKLAAHTGSFPPKPDEIHVQNGTLRTDGSFLAGRPEIVRSRFPIDYNPQAGKPVVWLRFLSDLLYPEDIPTFQEYIGYCLIPSTKGQRMMILKGEGGEGLRCAEKLAELLRRTATEDRVLVSAFNDRIVRHFRKVSRGRVQTAMGRRHARRLVVLSKMGLGFLWCGKYKSLQIPLRMGKVRLDRPSIVRTARRKGISVYYWTVNRTEDMERLAALGADGVITDRPDRVPEEWVRTSSD